MIFFKKLYYSVNHMRATARESAELPENITY
jgi:hypothetical protein